MSPSIVSVSRGVLVSAFILFYSNLFGQLRLSEISASQSDRLSQRGDDGRAYVGTLPTWQDAGFDDSSWLVGNAPIGFQSTGLATAIPIEGEAPLSLYLRVVFSLTAQQSTSDNTVRLEGLVGDGCVVWINGREAGRITLGPEGLMTAFDQPTFRGETGTVSINLGVANSLLDEGKNVLTLQSHRFPEESEGVKADPELKIGSTTVIGRGSSWAFFPGWSEPSGGLADTAWDRDEWVDWIELENIGSSAINLAGWFLSDSAGNPYKASLPNQVVPAGGYVILVAEGEANAPLGSSYPHVPFSLNSNGESLILSDPQGGRLTDWTSPRKTRSTHMHATSRGDGLTPRGRHPVRPTADLIW